MLVSILFLCFDDDSTFSILRMINWKIIKDCYKYYFNVAVGRTSAAAVSVAMYDHIYWELFGVASQLIRPV